MASHGCPEFELPIYGCPAFRFQGLDGRLWVSSYVMGVQLMECLIMDVQLFGNGFRVDYWRSSGMMG